MWFGRLWDVLPHHLISHSTYHFCNLIPLLGKLAVNFQVYISTMDDQAMHDLLCWGPRERDQSIKIFIKFLLLLNHHNISPWWAFYLFCFLPNFFALGMSCILICCSMFSNFVFFVKLLLLLFWPSRAIRTWYHSRKGTKNKSNVIVTKMRSWKMLLIGWLEISFAFTSRHLWCIWRVCTLYWLILCTNS